MKRRYQYRPAFALGNALRIGLMVSTCLGSSIGISYAGPEGGVVTGGSATIAQAGNSTNIIQHSDRALIDWDSFNIGQHESVTFQQNSSSSIAINRIHDTSPSVILGSLNANGQVMLINTNGVVFGNSAQVDVGGLVVSTSAPTDSDAAKFIAGQTDRLNLSIAGNPNAKIINAGNITARDAGLVGFVAPSVINNGIIIANKGSVQLASGDMATVDFYGDGLVEVGVSDAVKNQLIEQNGWVQADGGKVVITAAAGEQIVNSVINMGGVTQAHSIEQQDGKIILKGDNSTINVTGKIDASGKYANQKGGTITATAKHINLKSGSTIDASGDKGGGTIKIGGDYKGQGDLHRASTVTMEQGSTIYNDALTNGDGGTTILWSDDLTKFSGNIFGRGGALSGNGGFVETSGKKDLLVTGKIDLRASHGSAGTWLLDPTNIMIYNRTQGGTDNVNTVTTSYLEGQNAHINLVADNNITLDLTGDTLTLGSGYNLTLTATNGNVSASSAGTIITSGTGAITFIAGNNISLQQNLDLVANGSGSVTLQANKDITLANLADITTNGGDITFNADRDATNGGVNNIWGGSNIFSNGGNITLGGGANPLIDYAIATGNLSSGASLTDSGVGTLSPTLNAGGGNIVINGRGWNDTATTNSRGIGLKGAQIITSGNGNITLRGIGGGTAVTTSNNAHGIYLYTATDGQAPLIQAVNGTISLIGSSYEASTTPSYAIYLSNSTQVKTTGSGNIVIKADNIGSALGTLTGNGTITSGGNFTYIGDVISSIPNVTAAGDIIIRPNTNGTTVGVGTGSNTLQITNTMLGRITYGGTLWLGGYGLTGAESGYWNSSGDMTLNTTYSFAKNVNFLSGGNIVSGGTSTITLTGAANTTLWALGDILISHDLDITASGTGSITERAGGNIVYSGSGDITTTGGNIVLNSDRDAMNGGAIYLGTGTEVKSNGGNITFGGGSNPTTTAAIGLSTSYASGIFLDGATIDASGTIAGGSVIMNGRGWGSSTVNNALTSAHGVALSASTVKTNFNGTLTLSGTGGGTGTGGTNLGAYVRSTSILEVVNGALSVTGIGGTGTASHNDGISISLNGTNKIQSLGSGNITLTGTAGTGTSSAITLNTGNASTGIFSTSGNITLTGIGGVGFENDAGPAFTIGGSTATGTISLIVNALNYDPANIPTIQTTGDVIIRPYSAATTIGIGSGAGTLKITDTILNKITYGGTLWLGGYGLTGAESGYWNSAGLMTIDTSNIFTKNVVFSSVAGITTSNTLTASGTANVTLSGGTGTLTTNEITIGSGNLKMIADSIDWKGKISGTGTFYLQPYTNSRSFNIGGGTATGYLYLSSSIPRLQSGWSSLVFGSDQMTGNIYVGPVNWANNVSFITGSGNIRIGAGTSTMAANKSLTMTTISGDITTPYAAGSFTTSGTGSITLNAGRDILLNTYDYDLTSASGTIRLNANQNIILGASSDITTTGGHIILNSDRDATGGGAIYLGTGTEVKSNGGNITLGGGSDPTSIAAIGVSDYIQGIRLEGAIIDARGPSTTGGNITMNGTGWAGAAVTGNASNSGVGINLYTATVQTNNSGNITMNGTGGGSSTGDSNVGILLYNGGSIYAVNGLISLTGTGGTGSGGGNAGFVTSSYGTNVVSSTGTGHINIMGTSGSNNSRAITLNASNVNTGIFSTSGNITLTGIGGLGIATNGGGASATIGGSTANGTISFITDAFNYDSTTIPAIQTTGDVIIRPYSAATTIGIGSGAGTLKITDAIMDKITAGTLWLGGYGLTGAETGYWNSSGLMIINTTRSFANNVNFISGGSINSGGASTITLTGAANTTLWAVGSILMGHDLNITVSGTGSVTQRAGGSIVYNASGDITTNGGSIILNSDRDVTNGGAIYLGTGTEITSNGGSITLGGGTDPVTGNAAGISGRIQGIRLDGAIIDARGPSTTGGNIIMNGAGWSGASVIGDTPNAGIGINLNGATVRTNNSGTITMNGTGGGTGAGAGDSNLGIFLYNDAVIRAVDGLISLTGTGGSGSAGNHVGFALSSNGANIVYSTGSGDIEIKGTTSGSRAIVLNAGTTSTGIFSTSGNITLTGLGGMGISTSGGGASAMIGGSNATGTISLISNVLNYSTGTIPAIQTTGNVIIRPYSNGTTIDIGTAGSGSLQIIDTMLGKITAGTLWLGGYGLTGAETGYWNSAGNLTLNTTRSFANNVNFLSGGNIISGSDSTITLTGTAGSTLWALGDILISHDLDITASGSGSITQRAGGNIAYTASGDITTTGGAITLNSDRDATNGGAISLGSGTALTSNGGSITLGGGLDPTTTASIGNSTYLQGINILGANIDARGTSSGGNISIRGTGWANSLDTGPTGAMGVFFNGSTIQSNFNGNLTITGTATGLYGSGYNIGVFLYGNSVISAANGAINVTGTGGLSGTGYGVAFSSSGSSKIISTGSGNINVTATAANTHALLLNNSSGGIFSKDGNITLTADGSTGISNTAGLTNAGTIGGVNATGRITLITNSFYWHSSGTITPVIQTTGDVVIRPYTNGTTIDIGTGTSTLKITDALLNSITQGGTLWLGGYGLNASTPDYWNGSSTLTLNTTRSFAKNVNILSGASIVSGADGTLTLTDGANATLWAVNDINITHDYDITASGTGSVNLRANRNILYTGAGDIFTNGGTITLNSDYDTTNGGAIYLSIGTSLVSNGGHITLGGGTSPGTTAANGLSGYAQGINLIGVNVDARGVSTTGGNITMNGTGWAGSTTNSQTTGAQGIMLNGSSVQTNNSGTINLTGTGGGTGAAAYAIGLFLYNNTTVSGVNGLISLTGTGGSGSSGGGIVLSTTGVNRIISSGSGNIILQGSGTSNTGITINSSSASGGVFNTSGTISLIGSSVGSSPAIINVVTIGGASATGNIELTGQSIRLTGGTINTLGNATVTLNATGGRITTTGDSSISSVNGLISLSASAGIELDHAVAITSTAGNLTLNSAVTSSVAQTFQAGGTLTAGAITMGANNLTLTANDMVLNGNLSGTGTLTLQPYTGGRSININNGTDDGTSLHLSTTEIGRLSDNWGTINVGLISGTGFLVVGTSTWKDPVVFRNNRLIRTYDVTGTDNASLTFVSNGNANARIDMYGNMVTNNQTIDMSGMYYVFAQTGGTGRSLTTNGGNVVLPRIHSHANSGNFTVATSGGNITVNNTVYYSSAPATPKTLTLNAGTGTVSFGNTVNSAYDISVTGSTINFNGAWGDTTALGNVTLTSASNITLPAITLAAGKTFDATVTGASGKITTSSIATGTGGNITLTADDLDITDALSGTGTLTLQPYATDRTIQIARSTDNGTVFHLSANELARFTNNWGLINIGRIDNTADLNVGASSWVDPVNFRNGYRISVYGLTGTDNAGFTFTGNNNGWTDLRGAISTQGQDVSFNNGTNYSVVSFTDGNIATNGGNVTFSKSLRISSTGNRSITTNGGNINLNGGIKESSNPVSGTLLTLDAGTGTIAFGNTVDTLIDITALSSAMTFNGAWGGSNALGNVTLTSASSITLPAMTLAAGKTFDATVTGANGKITASSIATGTAGNITLTADDLDMTGNLSGTGTVTLQSYTGGRVVNINSGTDDGTSLHLSTTDIGRLSDNWGTINIGLITGTGNMYVGTSTWKDPVVFRNNRLIRTYDVTGTDNASLTFVSNGNATARVDMYGNMVTNNQAIDMSGMYYVFAQTGGTGRSLTTNGGNVVLPRILSHANSGNFTVATSGGNITVNNTIYYDSTPATPTTLTLNAGTGTVSFGNTVNSAYNISVTGSTINFNGAWGDTTALGNVSLTSANSLSLPSITANSIFARTTGATSDITIGSGKALTSSGANGITLVAGRNFINSAGAGALVTNGSGRWLVYSTDVTGTTGEEDLANNFNRYSCTYGGTCPTLGTGNGLLYSYTPLLTVTPTIVNVTYGNNATGLNGYVYSLAGYLGTDGSYDSVTGTINGVTDYVTGNDVGSYYLNHNSGSLASAMGYGFTYTNKANGVNVTPRILTATLTGNVTKVYDDNTDAALLAGNYVLSNLYNGDNVSLGNITSGTYNDENAGTGKNVSVSGLVLNGTKAGNYTLASNSISGNIGTITPKGLTVTVTAGQNKTYGQSDSALAYTYTGLVGNDSSANFTGALSRASGNNAGLYTISQGNLAATGNYTVTSFVTNDYTINKATIDITGPNGSRYYGYDNPNYNWTNATITGLQYGETGAVLDNLSFNVAGSATPTANAGTTHAISLGGFSDNNYTLGSFTGGLLTIAKAPLTITADSYIRVMIMPLPTLTASYSGLRNGETASVVSGLNLSTGDSNGAAVGNYTITVSGGTAANYNITRVNGTAIVTAGALPTTITNPVAVVQSAPSNNANNNNGYKDPAALLGETPNVPVAVPGKGTTLYTQNDPLVTFTPELRQILGI